jgi:hypothetical protein
MRIAQKLRQQILLKSCTLALIFMLYHHATCAESLSYTVLKGNDKIGKINISRTTKNNITEYFFESNVKLWFIVSVEVYDRMKVTFQGNQMLQSHLYRTLNGKVKVNNVATWNGTHYDLNNKDEEKSTIKHLIHLTTANLYFFEPKNVNAIFSEKFEKMIPVKATGARKYTLELPNGNKTSYSYENGICSLVEADTDWATLKFVRN